MENINDIVGINKIVVHFFILNIIDHTIVLDFGFSFLEFGLFVLEVSHFVFGFSIFVFGVWH